MSRAQAHYNRPEAMQQYNAQNKENHYGKMEAGNPYLGAKMQGQNPSSEIQESYRDELMKQPYINQSQYYQDENGDLFTKVKTNVMDPARQIALNPISEEAMKAYIKVNTKKNKNFKQPELVEYPGRVEPGEVQRVTRVPKPLYLSPGKNGSQYNMDEFGNFVSVKQEITSPGRQEPQVYSPNRVMRAQNPNQRAHMSPRGNPRQPNLWNREAIKSPSRGVKDASYIVVTSPGETMKQSKQPRAIRVTEYAPLAGSKGYPQTPVSPQKKPHNQNLVQMNPYSVQSPQRDYRSNTPTRPTLAKNSQKNLHVSPPGQFRGQTPKRKTPTMKCQVTTRVTSPGRQMTKSPMRQQVQSTSTKPPQKKKQSRESFIKRPVILPENQTKAQKKQSNQLQRRRTPNNQSPLSDEEGWNAYYSPQKQLHRGRPQDQSSPTLASQIINPYMNENTHAQNPKKMNVSIPIQNLKNGQKMKNSKYSQKRIQAKNIKESNVYSPTNSVSRYQSMGSNNDKVVIAKIVTDYVMSPQRAVNHPAGPEVQPRPNLENINMMKPNTAKGPQFDHYQPPSPQQNVAQRGNQVDNSPQNMMAYFSPSGHQFHHKQRGTPQEGQRMSQVLSPRGSRALPVQQFSQNESPNNKPSRPVLQEQNFTHQKPPKNYPPKPKSQYQPHQIQSPSRHQPPQYQHRDHNQPQNPHPSKHYVQQHHQQPPKNYNHPHQQHQNQHQQHQQYHPASSPPTQTQRPAYRVYENPHNHQTPRQQEPNETDNHLPQEQKPKPFESMTDLNTPAHSRSDHPDHPDHPFPQVPQQINYSSQKPIEEYRPKMIERKPIVLKNQKSDQPDNVKNKQPKHPNFGYLIENEAGENDTPKFNKHHNMLKNATTNATPFNTGDYKVDDFGYFN